MRALVICALLVACGGDDVSRSVGARCTAEAQCDERCLMGGNWPDGFCTVSCDTDGECPPGSACIDEMGGGACAFRCADDGDCLFLNGAYKCMPIDDAQAGQPKVNVCRG